MTTATANKANTSTEPCEVCLRVHKYADTQCPHGKEFISRRHQELFGDDPSRWNGDFTPAILATGNKIKSARTNESRGNAVYVYDDLYIVVDGQKVWGPQIGPYKHLRGDNEESAKQRAGCTEERNTVIQSYEDIQDTLRPNPVYVQCRAEGETRWSYLDSKGNTQYNRLYAGPVESRRLAQQFIDENAPFNPEFEWRIKK